MSELILIEWEGNYGGVVEQYRISNPSGNATSYDVQINKYHQGTLHKVRGEWQGYFNDRSKIGKEDIPTLSFIIENEIERVNLKCAQA